MPDDGRNTLLIKERVGKGSYGTIFKCQYENNLYAVKVIPIEKDSKTGIPNLMEASIMASIQHTYINTSINTTCDGKNLYIVQELAVSDLAKETRDKGLLTVGDCNEQIKKLRLWCYNLAEAVYCLHSENIIHCDIKASNVLLFSDGTIKLTDFSLSTKIWPLLFSEFSHAVCTSSYRPPECYVDTWNKSLDIWSLACTMYELAYGRLLFPNQSIEAKGKEKTRERYINCLRDFGDKRGLDFKLPKTSDPSFAPSCSISETKNTHLIHFHDLLNIMLVPKDKRADINTVLSHPFFEPIRRPRLQYCVRSTNTLTIPIKEKYRVERYISLHMANNEKPPPNIARLVSEVALKLYIKCTLLKNIDETHKTAACVLIADKLINPDVAMNIDIIGLHHLFETERKICNHLSFYLHSNVEI